MQDLADALGTGQEIKPGDQFLHDGHTCVVDEVFLGPTGSFVFKTESDIIKIYGERASVRLEDIGTFIKNLYTYRERLVQNGVHVPPEIHDSIRIQYNEKSGQYMVIHKTLFMGECLENKLLAASDAGTCLKILRLILASLGNLPNNAWKGRLNVGIDLIPRNFVSTNDKRAVYVDFVPVKIKVGNRHLLEVSEVTDPLTRKIGIYRHYYLSGIMHVLLVQMSKLQPQYYPEFAKEIGRYLKRKKLSDVLDEFQNRPVKNGISGQACDISVIEKMGFAQIYDLREIACFYAHLGLLSREQLVEFFSDSHFQSKPLEAETMRRLRQVLTKAPLKS